MAGTLSPYRLNKARELFSIFNVFNSLSWVFLIGNSLTLFVMRMGASSTYIGMLSAILYVSFFFLPLGRVLTNRYSMVRIYSIAWVMRAVGMVPALFAPLVFNSGNPNMSLLLIIIGVTIFHVTRGVGMVANNPILSTLSAGPDRGSYMTQIQIINSATGMFAGFVVALLLGREPPLFLYVLIISVGICCGIFSGILVSKIPEPEREAGVKNKKITAIFHEAMSQESLRRFIFILVLVALVSGVSRVFLVVYSRDVFVQSDGMVSLYSVFGGLGVLMAGLVIKFLVDKIGAKPIFIVCAIIGLFSMIPILLFPANQKDNFTTVTLFLTFLFFVMNFGWLGTEGVMNTYFMGLVPSEKMMDMSILYFFGFGVAGAGGSFLSGVLLDVFTAISGSTVISFKILYSLLITVAVVIIILMQKLVSLGALPFLGALEVMFSYKDLRTISLLDKLNKTSDSGKETALLAALHDSPPELATKGLLSRAKSPRLSVRMESIRAIDAMESLNEEAERALMDDIITNPYTTAYLSARALGNHKVTRSIFLLREVINSGDFMLAGEAFIALAKLGDASYREAIEEIISYTDNPRLKMMGVEAFGIFGSPDSLSVLLDILKGANPPPYLRDAVVLAMSSILNIQNKFYPLLTRFLSDESLASTLAMDEAEIAFEYYMSVHGRKRNAVTRYAELDTKAKAFQSAVVDYIKNFDASSLSRWILELPDDLVHPISRRVLAEILLDDEFMGNPRLRLLIVHWAAHGLRLWTNKLKT